MRTPKYKIGDKLKYLSKSPFDSVAAPEEELIFIVKSYHEFKLATKHTYRYVGFVPKLGMEQWKEEEELYS